MNELNTPNIYQAIDGIIIAEMTITTTSYTAPVQRTLGITMLPDAVKNDEEASFQNCIVWAEDERQLVGTMQELLSGWTTLLTALEAWRKQNAVRRCRTCLQTLPSQ